MSFPQCNHLHLHHHMVSSLSCTMSLLASFLCLFLSATIYGTSADPDTLQDICVADYSSGTNLNGYACKDSTNAKAEDFFFDGLAKPGETDNAMGSIVTAANVQKIPGLNTLGVSLSRIDYGPRGLNPPHIHPRASEIVYVLEGKLTVGFITTANALITKTIKAGDIFVFPRGLVHFQVNDDNEPASVIAAFNSQFPGTQSIGATLFAATPALPEDVLAKAFQMGAKEVEKITTKLAPKK